MENIPYQAYSESATKITNSLRQIHGRLRSDGVTCFFDPYLEAEALGATIDWGAASGVSQLSWPSPQQKGHLPPGIRPPEDAVGAGRVPVAIDVTRRCASLYGERAVVMAGVSGPLTLAARLTQMDGDVFEYSDLPQDAIELAATTTRVIATALANAGANAILINEQVPAAMTEEVLESWAEHLDPIFNAIRFFEALPVWTLTGLNGENQNVTLARSWNAVVCPAIEAAVDRPAAQTGFDPVALPEAASEHLMGVALPMNSFEPDRTTDDEFDRIVDCCLTMTPAVLTTDGDLSPTADAKRLSRISRWITESAAT